MMQERCPSGEHSRISGSVECGEFSPLWGGDSSPSNVLTRQVLTITNHSQMGSVTPLSPSEDGAANFPFAELNL